MSYLENLPVWKRLVLLVSVALVGLLGLTALILVELRIIEERTQAVVELVPVVRDTQKVIVSAHDARSHLVLGLQHNPAQPEIVKLHDHPITLHIEGARTAYKAMRDTVDLLRQASSTVAVEQALLLSNLDQAILDFDAQGIKPVIEHFEASPPRYLEANIVLLRQTNLAYAKLNKQASDLANAVMQSAKEKHEAMEASFRQTTLFVLIGVVLVLGLCVFVGLRVTRSITRQIGGEPVTGTATMKQVANGDLTVKSNAVAGSMLATLDSMIGSLSNMIQGIRNNATTLKGSAGDIQESMANVVASANSQADATTSVAASIEQLTVSISHIADSIGDTEHFAENSATEAEQGKMRAAQVTEVMHQISTQLSETSGQIRSLDTRSHEISSIAAVIKDIADQTNLLALNAAIEAARAGDSGRGFAVVADEVRKLAERTANATGDIEQMIANIQVETQAAVGLMEAALPRVAQSTQLIDESLDALEKIHESANAIFSRVREVSDATREQSIAATTIAQQVEQIAQHAEEASAAAQTTAEAVLTVEQQAIQLEAEAARFKV